MPETNASAGSAVAVTDTHALLWALSRPSSLGRRARAFFEDVEAGRRAVYLPVPVIVELGEAHARGRFTLPHGSTFSDWLLTIDRSRFIPVDLSFDIVARSLPWTATLERGDRLIAATALHLDCPLISRDPAIAEHTGLSLIW